jgi:hypothetical protein
VYVCIISPLKGRGEGMRIYELQSMLIICEQLLVSKIGHLEVFKRGKWPFISFHLSNSTHPELVIDKKSISRRILTLAPCSYSEGGLLID